MDKNSPPIDLDTTIIVPIQKTHDKIRQAEKTARLAPDDEYREGYLKAISNVIAILDEELLSKVKN